MWGRSECGDVTGARLFTRGSAPLHARERAFARACVSLPRAILSGPADVCVCVAPEGRTREWNQWVCVCVALEDQVCVWRGPGVCGARRPDARVVLADVCVWRPKAGRFLFLRLRFTSTHHLPPTLIVNPLSVPHHHSQPPSPIQLMKAASSKEFGERTALCFFAGS